MTEKHPKRPRDTNQLAKSIVDIATQDEDQPKPKPSKQSIGGSKRATKLEPSKRQEIARKAAIARWSKAGQNQP